jgi:penicillin-binding protein 1A
LGKGETGAVAALPIFIEFMQEALKGMPVMDFKAPTGTKFANVGPNREAFRPGTEPGAQALPVSAPGVGVKPFAITPIAPAQVPPISPAPPTLALPAAAPIRPPRAAPKPQAFALPAATPVRPPKAAPKPPDETKGLY